MGRYNEFDQLRVAGVRHADLKGFSFSREDVDARSLANAYAQILGQVFTHEMKPLEVEILVAEVGPEVGTDQMFHILYDGTVIDEPSFASLGGDAEGVADRFSDRFSVEAPMADALSAAVAALAGPDRTLGAAEIEAAVLDRTNGRRTFRRLTDAEIAAVLPADVASEPAPAPIPGRKPAEGHAAEPPETGASGGEPGINPPAS